MHANGCNAAMVGLIIARLKEPSSQMKMTPNEESWFGKTIMLSFECRDMNIVVISYWSKMIGLSLYDFSASMFLIGSTIGTIVYGIKSNYLGRKKSVMITQAVGFVGALCIFLANSLELLYIGNFVAGYTAGVFLGLPPIYTAEVNQPRIRNFTGALQTLTFFLGFAITYLVGWRVPNWRVAASIQVVWPVIIFVLMIFCPESPTWLMLKGRKKEAIETLTRLRGDKQIAEQEILRIELNIVKQNAEHNTNSETSTIKKHFQIIKKGTFLRPMSAALILMAVCWQWGGGPVIEIYTVDILDKFDLPVDPYLASTAIGFIQLLGGSAGIFISSALPRRKYYIGSAICVFVGALTLGVVMHIKKYETVANSFDANPGLRWIPVVAFLIYLAGYSTGYVAVCFMVLGELLPSNGREIGSFMVVQSTNISAIILIKFAIDLQVALGIDGLFFLFAGVSLFSILFMFLFVPETFGKTLEEMEDHYRKICYKTHLVVANTIKEVHANPAFLSE